MFFKLAVRFSGVFLFPSLFLCGGAFAKSALPENLQERCHSSQSCLREQLAEYASANKNVLDYNQARVKMFQYVDTYVDSHGDRVVNSVYSEDVFKVGRGGIPKNGVNTEHTWPQSELKKYPHFEESRADLYHLFPVEEHINGARGNMPFTECEGEPDSYGRASEQCADGFEPPDTQKGVVARALFYISVIYSMPIPNDEEQILRQWHAAFPVSKHEIERAQRIEEVQGNQNPFIDHPEWVDLVKDF